MGTVDPTEPGHYPACPFLALTGLTCPGCGTLRALHFLVHADVVAAVQYNLLTVTAVPLLAWLWGTWTLRRGTGRPRRSLAPPWRLWAMLVGVVAFWVGRNLGLDVGAG